MHYKAEQEHFSQKKDTGECFSTKLKSTCKNSGTFEGKKILPEKVTHDCLAPSHSIIETSSIASFKLFLIAWLREYCTFLDSSVVSLKSLPWPKYTQLWAR